MGFWGFGALFDLDVFVTGDAENVVLEDVHAREEIPEVIRDQVLERDETHTVGWSPDCLTRRSRK